MDKYIVAKTDESLHKAVKMHASKHNMSMTQWVLQAIVEKLKEEQQYDGNVS